MAPLPLGVWWLAVAALLWVPAGECQEQQALKKLVEEIMPSVIHYVRQTMNKIDDHERRTKVHFSGITKTLSNLNKKVDNQELLNNVSSALNDKLDNLETIFLKKEEREIKTQQETTVALEGIMKSIEALTSAVESLKNNKSSNEENAITSKVDFINNRLNLTDTKIDDVKKQITVLSKIFDEKSLRSVCSDVIDMSPFAKHIASAEELLTSFEVKLHQYDGNVANISEVALADQARNNDLVAEMKIQSDEIRKIQRSLSDAEGVWKELPKLSDFNELQIGTNQSLEAVVRATEGLKEKHAASMSNMTTAVRGLSARLLATNESIQQKVAEGTALVDMTFGDISKGLDALRVQLKALSASEHTIRQTADDVKANKKSIEGAATRVFTQLGRLLVQVEKSLKTTLNKKLADIENSILSNQTESSLKLESQVSDKMTQLWRQVGVINMQLTTTKDALGRLNVGTISKRTQDLSENLNSALTGLRRAADELDRMSAGMGDSMLALQKDVRDMQAKINMNPWLPPVTSKGP